MQWRCQPMVSFYTHGWMCIASFHPIWCYQPVCVTCRSPGTMLMPQFWFAYLMWLVVFIWLLYMYFTLTISWCCCYTYIYCCDVDVLQSLQWVVHSFIRSGDIGSSPVVPKQRVHSSTGRTPDWKLHCSTHCTFYSFCYSYRQCWSRKFLLTLAVWCRCTECH